jgi:medium-chain acyl-[acyl-carrier-protein] hydrolase
LTPALPWFVCFQRVMVPTIRLFCLPFAGGGALAYRRWHEHLAAGVEVWAVRPPGRETRHAERAHFRLGPLLDDLEREIQPWLDVPFALFGHSQGALVAFELARRLEGQGHLPVHVFVSAHAAPQLRPVLTPVHLSPDDVILERLQHYGGTPQAIYDSTALMSAILPNLRRDIAVSETYRYVDTTPLASPLTAFGGASDVAADAASMEAWGSVGDGRFRSYSFAGGHFYWSDDPAPLLHEIDNDLRMSFPPISSPNAR